MSVQSVEQAAPGGGQGSVRCLSQRYADIAMCLRVDEALNETMSEDGQLDGEGNTISTVI